MMFGADKPIIGVIHLRPLPGYPDCPGMSTVVEDALRDLQALEAGAVDAVLVENENDRPHRVEAAPETIAAMTRVGSELVSAARNAAVGVEILLNDPQASLAVAQASGATFIRTDYFVDEMERPEHGGRMRIAPEELLEYRRRIGAEDVSLFADIQVKYARMIEERSLTASAEAARRHGADGIVVTGSVTGEPPPARDVRLAKQGAGTVPVFIGSGLTKANAGALLAAADGAIVGSSLKSGPSIDRVKVRELVDACRLRR